MLKLAISGAAGRMGARLIDLGNQNDHFQIVDAPPPMRTLLRQ